MDIWYNSALITQSLIKNASLVIDKKFTLKRFFDFSSLCEAVVLFDKLQMMELSGERESFKLFNTLTESNVLSTFRPNFSDDEKVSFLEEIPLYTGTGFNNKNKEYIVNYTYAHHTLNETIKSLLGTKGEIEKIPGDTVTAWVDNVIDRNYILQSHNTFTYILRSIGYMHIANTNKIDYYPDFLRVPYIVSYLDRMYNSLPKELYYRICKCLELDLKEVDSYAKSTTLPIPPFTAIVLNDARSLDEIPFSLLDLRRDFTSFRKKLSKVDNVLKNPSSIDEKLKAINERESLLEQVSRDYKDKEIISFKEGLDFAKKFIEPINAPMDPTLYSLKLILQPVEWLQEWWLKRPVYPLFRVDKKVKKMGQYSELISKHWGETAKAEALNDYLNNFISHSNTVENIFNMFNVNPGDQEYVWRYLWSRE